MRARVLAAAEKLGYEPNLVARGLKHGATMTVAFIVRDISNPTAAEIVLGAEVVLRSRGYSMLLTNSHDDASLDAAHIRLVRQRQVDGLLLTLADERNPETLNELRRLTVPFVVVDRDLPADIPASRIVTDMRSGIREASEYLIRLGHRSIGLICGPATLRFGRECAAGLKAACRRHPEAVPAIRSGPLTREHGRAATFDLLGAATPATAIIAGGNQLIPGVLEAVNELKLRVPDRVSLVTVDDIPLLHLVQPPIAVVSTDLVGLGEEAARMLLDRIDGGAPTRAVVPTVFQPRESCGPPPR